MLVEVVKRVETREKIEVKLPYYYKHDLMLDDADSVIYGRIDEREHRAVQLTQRGEYAGVDYQICPTDWSGSSCYLEDKFKSDEDEYNRAKVMALGLLND